MVTIQKYGNTTAATIPLCLWDYENKLKTGDRLLLAAFGGGFTWGGIYMTWAYDGGLQASRSLRIASRRTTSSKHKKVPVLQRLLISSIRLGSQASAIELLLRRCDDRLLEGRRFDACQASTH
jgi:hypothetical protein